MLLRPVPDLFYRLVDRTAHCPNVVHYNTALSDHTGTETFYVSSGASTAVSSLFKPHEYKIDRPNVFFNECKISTITLDDWATQQNISKVDFLWLDMQGAELKVLKAAPTILSTVRVLVVEASLSERFKDIPLFRELHTWIEQQELIVIQHDSPKHNKLNMLCVRTKHIQ